MSQKPLANSVVHSPGETHTKFFICALPRSGTAWLANFFTWGQSFCQHEALYGVESLDRLDEVLRESGARYQGASDTAIATLIGPVYRRWPGAKYVFIRRDLDEIFASLERLGINNTGVEYMAESFWWGIANVQDAMVVDFDNLFSSITVKAMWEHIGIDAPFPFRRFEMLRNMHVEDGYGSGFGRFVDIEVIKENRIRFRQLCESCEHPTMEMHSV